jgi:hypothetical protein
MDSIEKMSKDDTNRYLWAVLLNFWDYSCKLTTIPFGNMEEHISSLNNEKINKIKNLMSFST